MNSKQTRRVLAALFVIAVAAFSIVMHTTYRVYAVQTGSMSPGIPARSLVVVKVGHYQMGEPIAFQIGHEVVTHRLVGRNDDGTYVTKGDGNHAADFTPVPAQDIIGGVVLSEPNLGFWLVYVTSPLGAASIAMSLLLLYLIWTLFTESPQSEPAAGDARLDRRDRTSAKHCKAPSPPTAAASADVEYWAQVDELIGGRAEASVAVADAEVEYWAQVDELISTWSGLQRSGQVTTCR